jgi:poly(3-hydroxybutyrate) depolymerase
MTRFAFISVMLFVLGACTTTPAAEDAPTDVPPEPRDAGMDMGTDTGPVRMDPALPSASGSCPSFETSATLSFSPAGIGTRQARIWVGPEAADADGPLVFYWHGAGGSPDEASYVLGDALTAITEAGGVVVAPVHDPAAGSLPWFLSTGSRLDDLLLADEVIACAEAGIGIDDHRIHAVGFSAGALHTTQMTFRRASYLASAVVYSGGLLTARPPETDAPDARFAVMMLFGGESDQVVIRFDNTTANYLTIVERIGHFGFVCDHGMGHTVPTAARASAWSFLDAHPYGAYPAAYVEGLPSDFYAPCALAD